MKIVPENQEMWIWSPVPTNRNGETEIMSMRLSEYLGTKQWRDIVSAMDLRGVYIQDYLYIFPVGFDEAQLPHQIPLLSEIPCL
jgi:hypothetical protein